MNGTNITEENHRNTSDYYIPIIVFSCFCIFVGIIGNAGVVAYNIFINPTKTPTTYFMVNLAICDILVCLTFFPPWLVMYTTILSGTQSDLKLICRIATTSSYTSVSLSIANLLAITVDRCIFVTKPLKYPRIMTWNRIYLLLAAIWLLAIANGNFIFFNTQGISLQKHGRVCKFKNPEQHVFNFINLLLPSIGLFYFNYKIFKVAKEQRNKIKSERQSVQEQLGSSQLTQQLERRERLQQMKIVKTFAIVLGVFFGCLLPQGIVYLVREVICKGFCFPLSVAMFAAMILGANSVMNPFIYSIRNKEYRMAYRRFFLRFFGKN